MARRSGRPKKLNKAWNGTYTQNTAQGFRNANVHCYRLALLQCLLHVPTFVRFIETAHKPRIRHSVQTCVPCSFYALVTRYWITRSPLAFPANPNFGAVANLYAAMTASIDDNTPDDVADIIDSLDQEDCMSFWGVLVHMLRPGGPVWSAARMFDIHDVETHTCTACNQVVNTIRTTDTERRIPILNQAPGAANNTLQAALTQVHDYTLTATCPRPACNNLNSGPQLRNVAVRIDRAPEILLMRVLRYDPAGNKLRQVLRYPEDLRLDAWARLRRTALYYRLMGVVCHQGDTVAAGHYIAVVRNRNDVTCTTVNDHITTPHANTRPLFRPHDFNPGFDATVLVYMKMSA